MHEDSQQLRRELCALRAAEIGFSRIRKFVTQKGLRARNIQLSGRAGEIKQEKVANKEYGS